MKKIDLSPTDRKADLALRKFIAAQKAQIARRRDWPINGRTTEPKPIQ